MAVPYRRSGTLDVATTEAELAALKATAEVLARRDVPAVILDAQAVRGEEPHVGDAAAGGLLIDSHGFVAAGEMTRALAAAAHRAGARPIARSRARRIARRHGDMVVETDRGSLTGHAVVLAAGSWSGEVEIEGVSARVPVRPVRGQLLHLGWNGTPLRRVTWSGRCYLVPWDDGTLLVGATVEEAGFDERTTVEGVRQLLDGVCALAPHARAAGFLGARVGLRPATRDDLPVIGRSVVLPNLVYATGHYRNGVLLAPLTAQVVADLMLDNKTDPLLAAVMPSRFGEL